MGVAGGTYLIPVIQYMFVVAGSTEFEVWVEFSIVFLYLHEKMFPHWREKKEDTE